jgi:hypothetical protein
MPLAVRIDVESLADGTAGSSPARLHMPAFPRARVRAREGKRGSGAVPPTSMPPIQQKTLSARSQQGAIIFLFFEKNSLLRP